MRVYALAARSFLSSGALFYVLYRFDEMWFMVFIAFGFFESFFLFIHLHFDRIKEHVKKTETIFWIGKVRQMKLLVMADQKENQPTLCSLGCTYFYLNPLKLSFYMNSKFKVPSERSWTYHRSWVCVFGLSVKPNVIDGSRSSKKREINPKNWQLAPFADDNQQH